MAKKPTKKAKPAGKAAAAGGGKAGAGRIFLMLGLLCLIPFSIPTLLLLFAGLLPTLVAALTDRSNSRFAWICVGGMNFAGLAPALLKLWFGHHEVTYAILQITDFRTLLLAYAAAAGGWMLYFGAPPVVVTIMLATTKRRAMALEAQMKRLEAEWGTEVARQTSANDEDDL